MSGVSLERQRGVFDLGGVPFELRSTNRRWEALARQRFAGFECSGRPELQVTYTSDVGPPGLKEVYEARHQPIRRRVENQVETFVGSGFQARVDQNSDSFRVAIRGPMATYPLDLLLEPLWYRAHSGGVIFHGGLLADQGRSWVCCGASGSGKTTLTGLFPEAALCDERVAVLTDQSGRLEAASLPFWRGRRGRTALSAVHVLKHGEHHRRRRLKPSDAIRRLTEHVSWPTDGPREIAAVLETLGSLVERVPVYELSFRPDPSVWKLLTQGEEA